MITLPELLDDKKYKEYFLTVPKSGPSPLNWRIYVQREQDGPWRRKDYAKYTDAFMRIKKELREGRLYDGTIQSKGIAYGPPQRIVRVTKGGKPVLVKTANGVQPKTAVVLWRPKLQADDESHTWCTYCRRPTVFRWFLSHHAVRRTPVAGIVDPSDLRCTICGVREDFVLRTAKSAAQPGHHIVSQASGNRRRRK